jgi:hypothetical protein
MKLDKQIKNYAKEHCANYINGADGGHCLFVIDGENKCLYERDFPHLGHRRCLYFEKSVLPENKILEMRYWETITEDRNMKNKNIDYCENCGGEMIKNHGKQRYCFVCAKNIDKQKARDRMRRKREREKMMN